MTIRVYLGFYRGRENVLIGRGDESGDKCSSQGEEGGGKER